MPTIVTYRIRIVRSALFMCLTSLIVVSCAKIESHNGQPNIVLINIDDMGWKDVGFMGSDYYETPNIDSLASLGMIFTNGYASASNCAPSRACLFTGKWTPRHGIYTVGDSQRGQSQDRKLIPTPNTTILSKEHGVLSEMLQDQGYKTIHAGKWHLSKDPIDYGFDVNIAGGHNGHPSSYYPPYKNVEIQKGNNNHLTDLIMEKTLECIDTINQPFFLSYSPYAVHRPIQPIQSLLKKYEIKQTSDGQNNVGYATMIENLDRNIGLLFSKLEDHDVLNNTIIIFTSDNGGLYGTTNQAPLRAGKGSYYEGGIRVPFFIVWKGQIKANTKNDLPISNLDIYPTLMGVIGVNDKEHGLDGISLLPYLANIQHKNERSQFWHFPIYLQASKKDSNENRDILFRTRPGTVMRRGNWKLHYYFEDKGVELYNIQIDIGERNNLAETNPTKTNEMLEEMKLWWAKTNAPIPKSNNPDFETH